MRIRTVKPDFFLHSGLFDLEFSSKLPVRLAYAGLWCAADREGRFKWDPRKLKVQILPYDEVDFSRVLDALTTCGFLERYQSEGVDYGWIPSFTKHQFVNPKETASKLPSPPNSVDREQVNARSTREGRVNDATVTRPSLPVPVPNTVPKGSEEGKQTPAVNGHSRVLVPSDKLSRLKLGLEKMFERRSTAPWSNLEETTLVEIARRPDAESELAELSAYKSAIEKRYFPHSIARLLVSWTETLDGARTQREPDGRHRKTTEQYLAENKVPPECLE